MNENIKKLMQKVAADESLQAKMKSFTDIDEAYEFASSIQDGFTKEEFVTVMTKISENISESNELSDEDLANVAGGEDTATTIGVAVATGTVALAAAF